MPRINPNIDRDAPASVIARKFGSAAELARAIGRGGSTVQKWINSGSIPHDYHAEIIAAAEARKLKLTPTDFVDARLFAKAG